MLAPALALLPLLALAAPPPSPAPPAAGWSAPLTVSGTLDGATASTDVLVYRPAACPDDAPEDAPRCPLVVALHGWGHTPALYRDKGNLAALAERYGLVLAVPAMGKTVYETAFYPESKKRWAPIPGTRFVGEVLLPFLRAHLRVASDRAHTAVVGYSTGGRGAVLVAERYPEFAFAGSLSGTFDLLRLDPKDGEYKIHAVIYGPRKRHADRWRLDNGVSPDLLRGLRATALYAAHGLADKVVAPDQLDALRDALAAAALPAELVTVADAGHDWDFWNAQSEPLFASLARALGLVPAPSSPVPATPSPGASDPTSPR